ncbi:GIN domain-containing protein [Chryseosolibacter indicus]|uniref:DUF2807 domain-containing protein n=1 Tax=Chryseosolibacter indicus TaxID=2782351 RepID=A0ABS5VRY7_9BACT|nr:DUF2807 domain-containing protein [Chryseosolibacter indicus]MBT1703534.1 DUF2807 domain-containing protein [Chryseosolibacter indicus]
MKKTIVLTALICCTIFSYAQKEIERELKPFNKIIASPRINVILKKGETENIRLAYNNVSESKINIEVRNKTLHIYLDDAKKVEKTIRYHDNDGSRHGIYKDVTITAYVTYKDLEALEIRGEQELTCLDPIESEQFKLRAYGENEITLASLKTDYFKASLYGENRLKIKGGKVVEQRYRIFGENKIDTQEMKSAYTSTSIFGEGKLSVNSSEEVRVNAFGEPRISIDGGAHLSKRLVFGKADISQN